MEDLQAGKSQVFVTTHKPIGHFAASQSKSLVCDHAGGIGQLNRRAVASSAKPTGDISSRDHSRGRGATDWVSLPLFLKSAGLGHWEQHGIHVTTPSGMKLRSAFFEALAVGGLRFGGFCRRLKRNIRRAGRTRKVTRQASLPLAVRLY